MTLYLAGKMRGIPYYNFPRFFEVAEQLERQGHKVLNPAKMDMDDVGFDAMALPEDYDWARVPDGFDLMHCIERDIKAIKECDGIYLLDGWMDSTGARAEKAIAEWMMKEILYETPIKRI